MFLKSLFPPYSFVLFSGFSAFLKGLILVCVFIFKNKALKSQLEALDAGVGLVDWWASLQTYSDFIEGPQVFVTTVIFFSKQ